MAAASVVCIFAGTLGAILALWLLWGPDRGTVTEGPSEKRRRVEDSIEKYSRPDEIIQSYARAVSDYMPLMVMSKRHEKACEECHSHALIWSRDPRCPSAWVALCRRCAKPRLHAAQGQTLEL